MENGPCQCSSNCNVPRDELTFSFREGTVWNSLKLFRTVWYCLEQFRTVWYCLVLFGTVSMENGPCQCSSNIVRDLHAKHFSCKTTKTPFLDLFGPSSPDSGLARIFFIKRFLVMDSLYKLYTRNHMNR